MPLVSRKSAIVFLVFALVITGATYVFNYLSTVHGEAFAQVSRELQESEQLRRQVGDIKSIRVDPWGHMRERHSGETGEAEFVVKVIGNRGEATIRAKARELDGVWMMVVAEDAEN